MILAKLNKISNWQAALIIGVLGFVVFFTGLTNPFQGDDYNQIVDSIPVHSITNIKLLYEGGTFYTGKGLAPLSGVYFRPLMTTVFSLIYTIFGPHPIYFHLVQCFICIGSSILLYLFFRYSFKPLLCLFLALVFLVHPIDSEVAFAIPVMQDALFFFFGILSLYLLVRFNSIRSLTAVALCLFLSMLAKESAILFIAVCLLYLFWWNRKRLYAFMGFMVIPSTIYLVLRIHAIGLWAGNPLNAPIDKLTLMGRLMTTPSIMLFYITKLIFPYKLASFYFWIYPKFSIQHVLIPIIIDLILVAVAVYGAILVRKKATKAMYYTYMFFGVWLTLGMLLIFQIVPLDGTVSEPWFYFPMAGLLGMIGVIWSVFRPRRMSSIYSLVLCLVIGILGIRTGLRGLDWRSERTLAYADISASKEDYLAYDNVADELIKYGQYDKAEPYVRSSISIYPAYFNYNNLAVILTHQGNYAGAITAYDTALKLSHYQYGAIYDNIAQISLVYGNPVADRQFIAGYALYRYPKNSALWLDLAILEDEYNDNVGAKIAVAKAASYGQVPQSIQSAIMNDQPVIIHLPNVGKTLNIP